MPWTVEVDEAFAPELKAFAEPVRFEIAALVGLLRKYGPQLGRPYADTLYDSTFNNMKELRCDVEKQVWRVAFAFDPERNAILLTAGDKRGKDQKRFYKRLIKTADERFLAHLARLKQ